MAITVVVKIAENSPAVEYVNTNQETELGGRMLYHLGLHCYH